MIGIICRLFLLAHTVFAITGPRIDNEFERRRQVSIGHPGFNEHQTRFGLNSPLQNFQQGIINPTQAPIFPPLYQQQQQQQQPYVPQFNAQTLQPLNQPPIQNIPLQNNLPQNNIPFFNQPQSIQPPILQNSFTPTLSPQLPQPSQSIISNQPIPTLPSFSQNTQYNPNLASHTVNIGQQRPTQASFLPTLAPQTSFNQPSSIFNSPPHSGGQNINFNDFQSSLNQNPIFNGPTTQQLQNLFEQQSKENLEKLKELQDRQRIIQKHQEFVQKQTKKQQEKVEKLHEEFVSKQASKTTLPTFSTSNYDEIFNRNQESRRPILPYETDLFKKAVEDYEKLHPTSTTSTTTTTTTTTTPAPTTRFRGRQKTTTKHPPQDRKKLYNEIKTLLEESETKGFDDSLRAKSVALLQKPDVLKQLRVALAENPEDFNEKNFTSREINLNGQKYEVIRTTNPNLIPKGAAALTADGSSISQVIAPNKPQKENRVSFEDLTKGVLPPGADFELIKHNDNGKLEEISKIPSSLQNKKKVTFVFLEEQDDGSYKVKGVKANGQQTEEGPEVESILAKIKRGEIQLPGPTKISNVIASTTLRPFTETDYTAESSHHPSSYSSFVTTSNHGTTGHTNPITYTTPATTIFRSSQTTKNRPQTYASTTRSPSTTERFSIKSTYAPERIGLGPTTRNIFNQPSTTMSTTPAYRLSTSDDDLVVIGSSTIAPSLGDQRDFGEFSKYSNPGLVEILKESGLFATAKYLKQSGLDTILNETGPYTIFAPTDKAFRTLLVQLGGPDKAEEKFRDNPRLLSGLLLHHVIPGAFDIASLQDEMTGVSLAGTQLRVNQYDMHDVEWNEVRVTTINGARVIDDKKDIHIPQGIAHAVDRVMFPLPVGDLVQTLQADRDRRFTTFLKAIYASGFADTLAESKTYTIFAPTDAAFGRLAPTELTKYADKAAAKALVARHVLPGTLYSAGMRYYQLRNTMEDAKPLTLQKNAGRIKVNNAQVITHNIPATNGVIHAIDNIL